MRLHCLVNDSPVSPQHSFTEQMPMVCGIVSPVVDLSAPVGDVDFSKDDLVICGRCRPTADDEPLFQPKALRSPKQPTLAERRLHELTHLPYADWCPHCVAGKRANSPHRRIKNHSDLPLLCCDYAFFGEQEDLLLHFWLCILDPTASTSLLL